MTAARHARLAAMAVVILLVCGGAAGAGCTGAQRQTVLTHSMTTLDASAKAFVAWDDAHQQQLVADATSLEDGQAKLKAYRAKRERALKVFATAYAAIALAATDPSQLGTAVTAVKAVYDTIRTLDEEHGP